MSVSVIGINHRTASVAVRERFAIPPDQVPNVARALKVRDGDEVVVLSTCNRVEFYLASGEINELNARVREKLASFGQVSDSTLKAHSYEKEGLDAVTHLFRVAASLDSMVVGEPQILGQLKASVQEARSAGTLGARLERLTSRAFSTAKKVRHQTGIGEQRVSISSVAVDLAKQVFGSFDDRKVLLLGAGKMAELAAAQFANTGAHLMVANRGRKRADELAAKIGGHSRTLDELNQLLGNVDVVIASTGAKNYLLHESDMIAIMKRRKFRPIFFIDIAVPRNIDPNLNRIDGVYLYDLDALSTITQENVNKRHSEVLAAEALIKTGVERLTKEQDTDLIKPTIIALRTNMMALVEDEVNVVASKLNVSDADRAALERLGSNIANKILHGAIDELKRHAGSEQQEDIVESVKRVFGVEDKEDK